MPFNVRQDGGWEDIKIKAGLAPLLVPRYVALALPYCVEQATRSPRKYVYTRTHIIYKVLYEYTHSEDIYRCNVLTQLLKLARFHNAKTKHHIDAFFNMSANPTHEC